MKLHCVIYLFFFSIFQKVIFKHFPDLQQFAIANVASVDTRESLRKYFNPLTATELHTILYHLNMLAQPPENKESHWDKEFLLELIVCN